MKTEYRIASAVKELMGKMPLEDISVVEITKKCKINRQSFYYHYHDVFDVLTVIFLNEKIDDSTDIKTTTELITRIYSYYEKNRLFVDASLNSMGKDLVKEFLYNVCYQSLFKIISNFQESAILTLNEKKMITRFYASAYSNSIVYYFLNFPTKSLNSLLKMFVFTNDYDIKKSVQNLAKLVEHEGKIIR